MPYKSRIAHLLHSLPSALRIDSDIEIKARPPTMASSMFLTNKEQGDWAETIVLNAINDFSTEFRAIKYGREDSIAASDPGFPAFFTKYIRELNVIGKRPDILIYRKKDIPKGYTLEDDSFVSQAVAAIEVRSSSFLAQRYADYMRNRFKTATTTIETLRTRLLSDPYGPLLYARKPELHRLLESATQATFETLTFTFRRLSSTTELQEMSSLLKDLRQQIKVLQKRDYLSITPKIEDLILINRWIQHFDVPHFYL